MMVIAIRRIYKDMLFDLYKYRRKKHKQQQRKLRLQFCNPVSTGAWRCRGFLLSGSGLTETASTNKYIVTAKKSKSKSPLKNDKSLYVSIFEGIPRTQILAKFLENCRISPSWELPLSALFMFFFWFCFCYREGFSSNDPWTRLRFSSSSVNVQSCRFYPPVN